MTFSNRLWRRLAGILLFIVLVLIAIISYMTAMPGKSFSGALPPLTAEETELKTNLIRHVSYLAAEIGERNVIAYEPLQKTAQYIEDNFKKFGYEVKSQEYVVQMRKVRNLIAEIPGRARANEIVVIGAHYDTVYDCPGADDNSSGVTALLELARILKDSHPARTVRFVAFVNEEPPWFQTDDMGSLVYAEQARKLKENIVAAISIETIGMYSDSEGSQQYPSGFKWLYPSKGNFILFIGNLGSRALVRDAVRSFRASVKFPSEGSAVPSSGSGCWLVGSLVVLAGRDTPRSWSRTPRPFAIPTTTSLLTSPIRLTMIAWLEWFTDWSAS